MITSGAPRSRSYRGRRRGSRRRFRFRAHLTGSFRHAVRTSARPAASPRGARARGAGRRRRRGVAARVERRAGDGDRRGRRRRHATTAALRAGRVRPPRPRVRRRASGAPRDRCVEGAVPWRKVAGAEACALAGPATGLRVRRDRRRARVPRPAPAVDRGRQLLRLPAGPLAGGRPRTHLSAPAPASVYVVLSEIEGRYDECLTHGPSRRAVPAGPPAHGRTLASEVAAPAAA